jgi:hypothetical protein
VLPGIRQIARALPSLHWGGFECRLCEKKSLIDFHQGIVANDNDLAIFEHHISSSSLLDNIIWNSIRRFCARLRNSSSPLHGKVNRIVLEFDNCSLPSPISFPSLFIGLIRNQSSEQLLTVVKAALEMLLDESGNLELLQNLRLCFDGCSDGAYITDLGIMLSRHSEAVRINVSGITPAQLQDYLSCIQWQGPANDLETTFMHLLGFVDHVVLCLDVGTKVYTKIGLECFFDKASGKEPPWATFLDNLVENGLCTPAKRDALLTWPGYTDPTTCAAPWPDNLIVESMLKESDKFSLFHRELSHIKINYQPNHPLEAKGYFGFHHIWTELKEKQKQMSAMKGDAL